MICPKCGTEATSAARYCGKCGSALFPVAIGFEVYRYNASYAKENGTYLSVGKYIGGALLSIIPLILSAFVFVDYVAVLVTVVLVYLAFLLWYCFKNAKFVTANQITFVYSKEKAAYYAIRFAGDQFHGWNTATRMIAIAHNLDESKKSAAKAQMEDLCVQIVLRYEDGEFRPTKWEKFWGGQEFVVTKLNKPTLIKTGSKTTTYSYENEDGKRKKIVIPNVYPYLHIADTDQ